MNYLYVVKCGNYHKIGITSDLGKRFSMLQTGNAEKVNPVMIFEIEQARAIERALHVSFEKNRMNGEWFNLSDNDLSKVRQFCEISGGKEFTNYSEIKPPEKPEWRFEIFGHGKYKGKYYRWRKVGDADRFTLHGGKVPDSFYK